MCHEGDQGLSVFFGDWWFCVLIVGKERWKQVFDVLALGVAHGVDGSVCAFGEQLVFQNVTAAIAADNAPDLPEPDVVEKFVAGDSDFAHEQLVNVVGAG